MKIRAMLLLLALALVVGFVSLGRWQLRRADEKQHMLDSVARALELKQAASLGASADPAGYTWTSGSGHFLDLPALLLDNQRRGDAVGVQVFRVFQSDTGVALLVELGWLPVPGNRQLPELTLPGGEISVAGLLTPPPSPGFALGPAYVATDAQGQGTASRKRWLLTRVDLDALSKGLGVQLAPRVLRLDPALSLGYSRDLDVLPNTLPPERHRGYALQWFGLALAMVILTLFLGFRRLRA